MNTLSRPAFAGMRPVRFVVAALVAVVVLASAGPARAQQYIWSTGTSGNWSVHANWGGSAPPAGGAANIELRFPGAGGYTATNNFAGNFNLTQLLATHTAGTVTIARSGTQALVFNGPNALIQAN